MAQRDRVVDAHLHAFVAEIPEDGTRDVLEVRVDDEPHAPDTAAARVAQQRERGEGDAVVAGQEVDGVDLAAGLLDDVDARLRRLARVVEDAQDVSAPLGRQAGDDE